MTNQVPLHSLKPVRIFVSFLTFVAFFNTLGTVQSARVR